MKRLIYSLLAMAATTLVFNATAQPQRMTSTERAQQIAEQMAHELQLDTKQQNKVEKIYTTYFDAMKANRPVMRRSPMGGPHGGGMRGGGMPHGERPNMEGKERPQMNGPRPPMDQRPDMQELRETTQAEIDKAIEKRNKSMQKVLTDKQYTRWQKIEQERMNRDSIVWKANRVNVISSVASDLNRIVTIVNRIDIQTKNHTLALRRVVLF